LFKWVLGNTQICKQRKERKGAQVKQGKTGFIGWEKGIMTAAELAHRRDGILQLAHVNSKEETLSSL